MTIDTFNLWQQKQDASFQDEVIKGLRSDRLPSCIFSDSFNSVRGGHNLE